MGTTNKDTTSSGYFELNDPCLVDMREWFNNLDKNSPEKNIAIARESRKNVEYRNIEIRNKNNMSLFDEYIYPTTRYIKVYDIKEGILSKYNFNKFSQFKYNKPLPYNFNNFKQFKSGYRSSNLIEGIKGLR